MISLLVWGKQYSVPGEEISSSRPEVRRLPEFGARIGKKMGLKW
jgi:hypothetical protein